MRVSNIRRSEGGENKLLAREWRRTELRRRTHSDIVDHNLSLITYQKIEKVLTMISSVKVEKFEPYGKAFFSQHPFASVPNQGTDTRANHESKNESVSIANNLKQTKLKAASNVTFVHLEKISLKFSSWSFAIRVNLLHP